jgi:drug/metabolite transporter (DMT)-like permease
MFVGEMGCWIVVGAISLYRRYFPSTSPTENGYEAISTTDAEVGGGDGGEEEDGDEVSNPARQPKASRKDGQSILHGFRILLLALPAICDICGTTLMNVGLLMVAASIYQMTRGALVLFVGLFSVVFLRRHLFLFQWLSLVGVVLGVAVVGLAGALYPDQKDDTSSNGGIVASSSDEGLSDTLQAIIGVLLIAGAQIFTATQFVLEEWILENSSIEPIRVVGWEGLFGFLVTTLSMVILHFAIGRTPAGRFGYFDMVEGWRQMTTYPPIFTTSVLIMISIG